MIGESMPDQHKQAIAQLSAQIDHYLATGRRIQMIDAGISGEVPFTAISNRPKNLKAKRDKHEPRVHELAAQGSTASAIATATATAVGIDSRTVRLSPKSTTLAWPNRPDAQDKQPRTPAPPASLAGLASAPVGEPPNGKDSSRETLGGLPRAAAHRKGEAGNRNTEDRSA